MASPKPVALQVAAHVFAAIAVGFGINAIVRPAHALTFFELERPTGAADAKVVDALLAVYGVRDIFVGFAIFAAAVWGTSKSLGWTVLAFSAVAFADGLVCYALGQGQWNHWGYAPMVAAVGTALVI